MLVPKILYFFSQQRSSEQIHTETSCLFLEWSVLNLICVGWVLGDPGIPCSFGGGRRRMWPSEVSGPLSQVTGALALGLDRGHRSAGSLIQLCAGAWRHSPQFVKQERVTPKGLSWLPWPNIGLKHYQPPHDAPRLPINSLLQKPGPISLMHTLNTSPALIRGITPAGAKNPGEGGSMYAVIPASLLCEFT